MTERPTDPTPAEFARMLQAIGLRPRERSTDCPDEHLIAAYVDGCLAAGERETLERHLADCAACLSLVGLLAREIESPDEAAIPRRTLARAREVAPSAPVSPLRHAPRWAAAAAALAVIPLVLHLSRPTDGTPAAGNDPAPRVTRNAAPHAHDLQVLSPVAGAVVEPGQLAIRWSAVPGSAHYDVRIVTDSGDPVVERRVIGTEWRPGAGLLLQPGVEYYVRVDAYPTEGKSVGSMHVPFRVKE